MCVFILKDYHANDCYIKFNYTCYVFINQLYYESYILLLLSLMLARQLQICSCAILLPDFCEQLFYQVQAEND